MKKIVLATNNENKVREIKEILNGMEIISKSEIGQGDFDVEETEDTLEGNALLKASGLKKLVGDYIVVSDDTGLFVDYLNGAPGVRTARFSGDNATSEENRKKLLALMKDAKGDERKAEFRTVICVLEDEKKPEYLYGILKGRISEEERGDNGFGYDPIFIPDGMDITMAEMKAEEKNKISHRSRALKKLKEKFEI